MRLEDNILSINKLYEDMKQLVIDETLWLKFGQSILLIVLIFVLARVAVRVLHKSIDKIILQRMKNLHSGQERRFNTVGKLLKNTVSYIIYFIMALLILAELGISLGPLLAGAGIAGVAIGFGAQSIVKDVITGFFIVIEDQFAVGDTIQTGAFKGVVEVIGLRTTRIVSESGEVHIIPNSAINQVTNYSINKSKLNITVELDEENWEENKLWALKDALKELQNEKIDGKLHVVVTKIVSGGYELKVYGHCEYTDKKSLTQLINNYIANFKLE